MQYPNGSLTTHPQQTGQAPAHSAWPVPIAELRLSAPSPSVFKPSCFSCAGNKASPTGPWSLPQHFDSHTNTPALLADKQAASLEEGAACVLRPQGSVGLEHSWNEGIKQTLIQQSHCQARGACALAHHRASPISPTVGSVNALAFIFQKEVLFSPQNLFPASFRSRL